MARNLTIGLQRSLKRSLHPGLIGGDLFTTAALDLNFARYKTLGPRITFTRASTGTYVGSDGLIKTATTNEARFDHNPITGESLGLLVEEARTNLILQSESINNVTNWNKIVGGTGSTPVVNANSVVAPDGTTTADQIILALNGGTTVNDSSYITQSYSSTSGTTYVVSIWLRTASGNVIISLDVDSQNINTITVTPVWQRFSFARTSSSTASRTVRFGLRGTFSTADSATFYAWGVQLEEGAFATSYIPTTTATVTRAADVASITGTNFSSWYNQTEGTSLIELREVDRTGSRTPRSFSDGTASNRIDAFFTSSLTISTRLLVSGSSYNPGNLTLLAAGTVNKHVISAATGSAISVANGTLSTESTPPSLPVVNRLVIGADSVSGTPFTGTIRRLTYWPVRLANATLQSITTP